MQLSQKMAAITNAKNASWFSSSVFVFGAVRGLLNFFLRLSGSNSFFVAARTALNALCGACGVSHRECSDPALKDQSENRFPPYIWPSVKSGS
jgi:hypothetical protein